MRKWGLVLAVLAVGSCEGVGILLAADADKTEVSAVAVAEGDQIWTSRCSLCHGATGKGDGPAAGPLNPKPRDLSDPKWQASVDDAHIETIIREGGTAVKLSPMMPANPDLASKPEVVRALRTKVRSVGGK